MARADIGFFTWLQAAVLYGEDAGIVNAYETAAFLHRYPAARARWIDNATDFTEDVGKHLPSAQNLGRAWDQLIRDHLDRLDEAK